MDEELIRLAEVVGLELKQRELTLATAESCTGGGLSYYLTAISGASNWFYCGFVTYTNRSKTDLLGLDPDVLKTFGAVSEETAREMALCALDKSNADVSIAITGIAGPTGGTQEKPVGTVWIALAKRDEDIKINDYLFTGNRQIIRETTIKTALENLLIWITAK